LRQKKTDDLLVLSVQKLDKTVTKKEKKRTKKSKRGETQTN
jgi:hypothetical protein